jgi:hypothetical protein
LVRGRFIETLTCQLLVPGRSEEHPGKAYTLMTTFARACPVPT